MSYCNRLCSQCRERRTCDKPLWAYITYGEYDSEFKIVFLGWRNRRKAKYKAWKMLRAVDPLFTESFISWVQSADMRIQTDEPLRYGGNYLMDERRKDDTNER